MDILVIASEAPPIVSGVSRCVDRLSGGLRDRGHRVDVLSSVEIPRLSVGEWRFSSFIKHWPEVAQRLPHYDVVNLHGPVPTMSDVFLRMVRKVPKSARPALIYTHHSAPEISRLKRMCEAYDAWHKTLARSVDHVITTSSHYAECYRSPGGPPVHIVPWGVDRPDGIVTRRQVRAGNRLRVLFVGQMRPYKGVDVLLRAIAGRQEVELTLVGTGPRMADYRRLAAQLAASNVSFLGRVSDERLQAEYARNDVIVLPSVSRAEAFGLVLLEGMSAECVPVASDLPGVSDITRPTGLVVPPRDPAALRAALIGLARDRERTAQLQAKSRRFAQSLTWDRCVDSYEQVFGAVESNRGREKSAA